MDASLPTLLPPGALRSRHGTAVLTAYLASLHKPNAYGYRPLALEWDVWISPTQPHAAEAATVDHGTSSALVTQVGT